MIKKNGTKYGKIFKRNKNHNVNKIRSSKYQYNKKDNFLLQDMI